MKVHAAVSAVRGPWHLPHPTTDMDRGEMWKKPDQVHRQALLLVFSDVVKGSIYCCFL
jgi:hypothetical protein